MLKLTRVSKSIGSTIAVDRVDLEVCRGQTVALIGPSGCGKSTLVRLMIGLLRPDRGRIEVDGEQLSARSLTSIRGRIGYVIQSGGLFPHLTARENAALQAQHAGLEASAIERRLAELLELTQLGDGLLERYPAELSGGQRQRFSLVRALMLEPEILLLDEPLGALDPMIRADLQEDLKSIFEVLGAAVVLVTHDLAEADFFTDRLLLMDGGRLIQEGSFRELRGQPASELVQRFVSAHRSPGATA
ncbi:MAG: ATP-binding cassette domain-containing protein [Acidobacteriota bacterium]